LVEKKDNLIQIKSLFSICFVIGILILNFVLVYPIFFSAYTHFLGSFEAAYISEARFISNNFPHLSYNPLWHLGFPFYLFYNPLLPFLISGFHFLTNLDFSYLYRILTGFSYIAAPLTLYLFVKYLTRKEFPAVLAALAFSTPTNFFVWLAPNIWEDIKTYGFVPWKLIGLTVYGQGPHIIALALIPLACLFFLHTLKYPNLKYYVLTGITTAAVALTHWPSFIILILMQGVLLFSEILLGQTLRKIKTAFFAWLLTYGLAAFWLNPAFLARSYTLGGEEVLANWAKLIPISFVVVPVTIPILFLIFDRRPRLQPFLVALLWFLIPFLLIVTYNIYGKALVPKPDFLTPELGMASAILLAVVLTIFTTVFLHLLTFKLNERVYHIANLSSFVFIIGVFIYLASSSSSSSLKLTKGHQNIKETPVYQATQHLDKERETGRVLSFGDSSLWLNVFSNLPQVDGFSELGNNHPFWEKGAEEVRKSKDPETVLAWFSALNVKYLVVPKGESQKYEGFLEKDVEIGDLALFHVPLKNPSLVKIVNTTKVEGFPFDGLPAGEAGSEKGIKEYQELIEENPVPEVTDWPKNNQLKIDTHLEENQGIVVQTAWDKGLFASLNGQRLKVQKDPLGFVYLKPEESGFVSINLSHKLPGNVYFGYVLTLLTLLYLGLLQIKPIRKFLMWQEVQVPPGVLIRPEELAKEEINPELIEKTKKYYQEEDNLDWVKMTDQFKGIVNYFHKNREDLVKKLVEQYGEGKKYLDAGCGTGLLLRHLPPGSVGLDINPRGITKAKEYVPKAALVVADIEEIPFPGNMFETVLCVDVLDRLPRPDRAISEIERVLKKGGILIGTVPALNPLWRLQFLTTTAPETEPYRKEYTKREIERLLAPFKVIHLSPALSGMTWAFVCRKAD